MKNQLNQQSYYETSDLALAVALSLYFPIDLIDKSQSSRAKFIFKRTDGFDEYIESHWRGDLRVEPKQFFNQLRNVKARLYESP